MGDLLKQKWERCAAFMPLPGKRESYCWRLSLDPDSPGPRKKADSLPKCKGTKSESTSVSFLPVKLTARETGENILFPTLLRNQYELEMGLYGCKLAPCFWYLGILGVSLEVMGDSFKESCVKEITCHSEIIKTI